VGVSSIGVEGIGFAIPVETVTRITGELIATGTATHPGIGITASETPGDTADGGMRVVGLTIEVVSASSPAEAARLRAGDMITAIDDIEVSSMTDLTAVIAVRSVGDTVTLSVVGADGTSSEVTVTLADRPAA
jgi:S1-C subfamily serine protease